jgi:hypothetical protein
MAIKPPDVGDMRQLCTLLINAPTRLTAGWQDNYSKSDAVKVHGSLQKKNGKRTLESGEVVLVSYWELKIRCLSEITSAIKPSSKWLIDGELYTIETWEKIDNKNKYLYFRLGQDQTK